MRNFTSRDRTCHVPKVLTVKRQPLRAPFESFAPKVRILLARTAEFEKFKSSTKEGLMSIRKFAFVGGIIMLVMGIISLIPQLSQNADGLAPLKLNISYGLFIGFFAMNILNKLALIAFGVAGILASRADDIATPINYARTVAIVMGVLAVFGFIPGLSTMFGYMPLFGGEIIAHAAFAAFGAYYGYSVAARQHLPTAHA